MSDNAQKQGRATLRKATRISKALQLQAKGYTLERIAEDLGCNEKTIRRNLKDEPTQSFIDALVQQQLEDIVGAKIGIRLHYRDKLLEKMMPRKVEQKTEGKLDLTVDKGKDIAELLTKYDSLFMEKGVASQNSSQQSVDPARANAETS